MGFKRLMGFYPALSIFDVTNETFFSVFTKKREKCRGEEDIFQIYTAVLRKDLISFLLNGKIPTLPISDMLRQALYTYLLIMEK